MITEKPVDPVMPRGRPAGSAAARLADALATLTAPGRKSPASVTVTALCELAEVSRNTLYRYHRGVLESVRQHQQKRVREKPYSHASVELKAEIDHLRALQLKLIALADHYYCAHCESLHLLKRRERELAELRRQLDSRPRVLGR